MALEICSYSVKKIEIHQHSAESIICAVHTVNISLSVVLTHLLALLWREDQADGQNHVSDGAKDGDGRGAAKDKNEASQINVVVNGATLIPICLIRRGSHTDWELNILYQIRRWMTVNLSLTSTLAEWDYINWLNWKVRVTSQWSSNKRVTR